MVDRSRERGAALLVALVAIVVVTMSVLLVAGFIQERVIALRIEERNVMVSSLADAAMAETLARLAENQSFRGIYRQAYGDGEISSTVVTTSPGRRRITANGYYQQSVATIEAEVGLRRSHPRSRPRIHRWFYDQGLS